MTAFNNSPFAPTFGLVEGQPAYSMGTAPIGGLTRMRVTTFAITSNVATIGVQIYEGNIPLVNDLITITKLPLAAGNVSNVALASVSITATTGIGTLTFALSNANVASGPVAGMAISIPQAQPETIVANQAGQAFAIPRQVPDMIGPRQFALNVITPAAPGNLSFTLQGAISNVDAEYAALGNNSTATGTVFYTAADQVNFVRYKDTGSNNLSSGTIIAKILM